MPPLLERVAGYERYTGPGSLPVDYPPVPGVGPLIGVRQFGGLTLAIRSDGETPVLYVAGETEWEKVKACDAPA